MQPRGTGDRGVVPVGAVVALAFGGGRVAWSGSDWTSFAGQAGGVWSGSGGDRRGTAADGWRGGGTGQEDSFEEHFPAWVQDTAGVLLVLLVWESEGQARAACS